MVPVRFDACLPSRPFLPISILLTITLGVCYGMQVFFWGKDGVLTKNETEWRVVYKNTFKKDPPQGVCRWLITLSEAFRPNPTRVVLTVGNILAVLLAGTCFANPAHVAIVFIAANALEVVGVSHWWQERHEFATYLLSVLMLLIQLSVCLVYLRPQYPIAVWASLVAVQLFLVVFFAWHVWAVEIIRQMDNRARLKDCLATMEWNRLAIFEFLNIATFLVSLDLTTG